MFNSLLMVCVGNICRSPMAEALLIDRLSDDENVSTTQLLRKIAAAFNKKALLLPVPVSWMIFVAKLLGKKADAVRLFSSLVVDSSKARDLLDWHPIKTIDEQLCKITENEKSI